jgi:DNA modification methylase
MKAPTWGEGGSYKACLGRSRPLLEFFCARIELWGWCSVNSWPADQIERWPIGRLVPYARNARTHSDTQVAQLAGAIREFGWTNPVLVAEDGMIIAGHGRILAAHRLGIKDVPVVIARGWSDAKKRAYVIADNKLALNAGWNNELLAGELADLRDLGADLNLIGFSDDEIAGIFAKTHEGLTDPDDAPEPPAKPASGLGDVWVLDRHRLVCGDCTEATTVDQALAGIRPGLMVTDPPYGVRYDPNWRNSAYRTAADGPRGKKVGGKALGAVLNDDRSDWREAWALFPGDVAYVWHASLHVGSVVASLEAVGFELRAQVIWDKQRPIIGRAHYHWQHEPCWYAVRKGATGHWAGDRKQTTVWQIEHRKSDTGHGTQKPVDCMRRPILNNSNAGQVIYDPFVGSGTTMIAAEMTGRTCHAIELNPSYVDVAVRRWEAFTGNVARLETNGKSYSEVAEERGVILAELTDGAARPQA